MCVFHHRLFSGSSSIRDKSWNIWSRIFSCSVFDLFRTPPFSIHLGSRCGRNPDSASMNIRCFFFFLRVEKWKWLWLLGKSRDEEMRLVCRHTCCSPCGDVRVDIYSLLLIFLPLMVNFIAGGETLHHQNLVLVLTFFLTFVWSANLNAFRLILSHTGEPQTSGGFDFMLKALLTVRVI